MVADGYVHPAARVRAPRARCPTAARSLLPRSAPTKMAQMSTTDKIDVSIEHKRADPAEAGEGASEHLPRLRFALPRRRAFAPCACARDAATTSP